MQLKTSGLLPVLAMLSIRMAVIFSISVRRSSREISDVGVPILTHYCGHFRGEWACWLFIIYSSLFITTSLFSEVVPCFHKHKYAAVQYSERLSGDKTLRISRFVPIHGSFLHKIWLGGHFGNNNSKQSKKSFLQEDFIFCQLAKVLSLDAFFPYAVCMY